MRGITYLWSARGCFASRVCSAPRGSHLRRGRHAHHCMPVCKWSNNKSASQAPVSRSRNRGVEARRRVRKRCSCHRRHQLVATPWSSDSSSSTTPAQQELIAIVPPRNSNKSFHTVRPLCVPAVFHNKQEKTLGHCVEPQTFCSAANLLPLVTSAANLGRKSSAAGENRCHAVLLFI